jgi:hypothetical protein
MKIAATIAAVALAGISAAGIAACSSGSSASTSTCIGKISGSGGEFSGSIYMSLTDSSGSISASQCNTLVNGGNTAGVTSSVVSSLPSGLNSSCTGTEQQASYTVYSDGSSGGNVLASAVCSSLGHS